MLQNGTSWTCVRLNIRKLVDEWERAGRVGTRRPETRKEAIDYALAVSLRHAGRCAHHRT